MRLYRYDVATTAYIIEPILLDDGSELWGEGSNQWSAWSFLYELYRTNNIGMTFAPATFAGIGNQSALVSLRDPVGYLTSLIINSSNLPAGLFREYVSDSKNIQIQQSIKKGSSSINLKPLLVTE